jgi:hypothetical protein
MARHFFIGSPYFEEAQRRRRARNQDNYLYVFIRGEEHGSTRNEPSADLRRCSVYVACHSVGLLPGVRHSILDVDTDGNTSTVLELEVTMLTMFDMEHPSRRSSTGWHPPRPLSNAYSLVHLTISRSSANGATFKGSGTTRRRNTTTCQHNTRLSVSRFSTPKTSSEQLGSSHQLAAGAHMT